MSQSSKGQRNPSSCNLNTSDSDKSKKMKSYDAVLGGFEVDGLPSLSDRYDDSAIDGTDATSSFPPVLITDPNVPYSRYDQSGASANYFVGTFCWNC